MVKREKVAYLILLLIIAIGFFFRFKGIQSNASFWSDEAYISSIARSVLLGQKTVIDFFKIGGSNYQPLYTLTIFISFVFLGATEFAARLPSVIIGTVGIIFAFLIARKLSNLNGGVLAAFLYAFSQINIANATQAKPQVFIETGLLVLTYLLILLHERKGSALLLHSLAVITILLSTLFHLIGILLWIPYLVFLLLHYKKELKQLVKKPMYILSIAVAAIIVMIAFHIPTMLYSIITPQNGKFILAFNNTTFFRELIWRNYCFLVIPALFGAMYCYKNWPVITTSILAWTLSLVFFWNFRNYSHNIRYLLPLFGLIIIFFAVFWEKVGDKLFNKRTGLVCLLIAFLVIIGGYKFVRKPSTYYSPNADLYGDVQNADYKTMYSRLTDLNQKSFVVITDTVETNLWYYGKAPDALFQKANTVGLVEGQSSFNAVTKTPTYTSLNQFIAYIKDHPQGVLISPDWQSFLPEDIKAYAKKNLHFEYRVNSLNESPGDVWPLEVYSWGL